MIAGRQKDREVAKRHELVRDEVGPGGGLVGDDVEGLDEVLVEGVDGAEISEVPVEVGAAGEDSGGEGGHDDVAAIAGVAGDGEFPGGGLLGGERGA